MSELDQQLSDITDQVRQTHFSKKFIEKQRSQQARQIEEELRVHLNQIVTEIIQDGGSDISLIQRQFGVDVEHIIRAAANNAYAVGVNYVGGIKKKPHYMFITESDIKIIKSLTQSFTHIFWRRVGAVLHQKDTIQNILKNARFSPRSKLSLNNLISSLAVRIVTRALAVGTVEKIRALSKIPSDIKSAQSADMMVWVTAHDELVCAFCASLDGMEWGADDPNMLVPGDDSHDNCRCTLDIQTE